ncbi:Npt1/Npt2 family nucleotide transporter [Acidobacteriota bacterium]
MKTLYRKLFDIREGEGIIALLMFSTIFLLIASLMILKPVRNSLFLVKIGVEKLPFVFVLVALAAAVVASVYSKYSEKVQLNLLFLISILISIASLLVFWFLFQIGYQGAWLFYTFYAWVAIFSVIVGAQFWLLANFIFNAREAKRLFGFIGAGAISGGIFGGYITSLFAPKLKTENMIFFCIGFLLICSILIKIIWKKNTHYKSRARVFKKMQKSSFETTENPVKLILSSRHLVYLASIIGISVTVANLAEYQFSAVASRIISNEDQLTAFFGFWMSNLNIVSLAIQLLLTSRIMKYLGVTTSLFFLPLGLLFGAFAILVNPALWSAILIKVSDGSLKHSINRAGTELLILPIPSGIKKRVKTFIDVFIKNLATGIGGLLLIILTIGMGFSIQHISLIIIGLIGLWIFLITQMRVEYTKSFKLAIEKRTIDIEQQSLDLQDASIFKSFVKVLDGQNNRQILYVLNLLEDTKNKELIPYLKKLINHPSNEVKAFVLKMAFQYDEFDLSSEAKKLINFRDQTLQIEALHYLIQHSEDKISTLMTYLNNNDYRLSGATMMCVAREWKMNKDFRKKINIKVLLDKRFKAIQKNGYDETQKHFMKINASRVIGIANNPELYPYLHVLLNDKSLDVVQEAITDAGHTQAQEFVPILFEHLETRHVRKYARESLAEYGENIIDNLAKFLENTNEEKKKRNAIPKVLSLIGSQKSVNFLMKNLEQRDLHLRFEIIKALNKIRIKFPWLKFNSQLIATRIFDEIKQYKKTLSLWLGRKRKFSHEKAPDSANQGTTRVSRAQTLLSLALEEKLDHNMERIFRLLGLKYPPKDMFIAYLGIKSNKSNLRANAIEFLDNVLQMNLKRYLIPIIEANMQEMLKDRPEANLGLKTPSEAESINLLLQSDDNWLKACTLYLVVESDYNLPTDMISGISNDPDPIIKESLQFYLQRRGISN